MTNGTTNQPILLWFRQDLRLSDHEALTAAVASGQPVIPFYVMADDDSNWPMGGASKVWLSQSLQSLGNTLAQLGSRLILRQGQIEAVLKQLILETGAQKIYASRCYEPEARALEAQLQVSLKNQQVEFKLFDGALLHHPDLLLTQQGKPYQVYTPFWKSCALKLMPEAPLPAPSKVPAPAQWPDSLTLNDLNLLPRITWDTGIREGWSIGELAAQNKLQSFVSDNPKPVIEEYFIGQYQEGRNRPDKLGTSRLSPYLHFGQMSPRQIWYAVRQHWPADKLGQQSAETYLKEIVWREFAYHLLYHFPQTDSEPLKPQFKAFPWRAPSDYASDLLRWQKGLTGYPIVDAGMRELWATGWMHNRVRMIVASFLVKDLLIPWQEGAAWFWDTLVDADLPSNTLGWQWTAGCGADAAPYFRVFNPVLQGLKFDPDGTYIKRWIPELAEVPTKMIHEPWLYKEANRLLAAELNYPEPIVNHHQARDKALTAYSQIKGIVV